MTVTVDGPDTLARLTSFSALQVDARIAPLYHTFTTPTPIQQYTWPALLAKHDVVGISATGSGKTLAFSIPLLHRLFKHRYDEEPGTLRWVTIAPTRELALQTYTVIKGVIPTVCLYGGVPKREQVKELREVKPVAIVATPGRLQDLIDGGEIALEKVRYLVLDEADRMLDAGFEPAVSRIVSSMPAQGKRQTVLFSATWPSSVQKMARKYMASEGVVRVTVSEGDAQSATCSHSEPQANLKITQKVLVCEPYDKDRHLLSTLSHSHKQSSSSSTSKAIVFVLYKKEAPRVQSLLTRNGYQAVELHGDMSQHDRTAALDAFKSGSVNVLIATDVAARGLDIPNVSLVFNYTFPLTIEDYVHRIGRTGRGGASGNAVTLFTGGIEKQLAGSLQNVLKQANQPVPKELLAFGSVTKKRVHSEYGSFYREDDGKPMPAATRIKFDD
jgi:ATP-dependent RNA helicase DBP3